MKSHLTASRTGELSDCAFNIDFADVVNGLEQGVRISIDLEVRI